MKKNNTYGQNNSFQGSFYSKFSYNNYAENKAEANSKTENINSKQAQDIYNKYSNLDEDSLMNTIYETASTAKKNGELNNESIENFYRNASGMLNEQQRVKLRDLLDKLKESD